MIIGFKNHGLLIRFVIIFFCLNTYSFGEVTNSLARFNLIESFEADFTQKVFEGESTVEEIVKGKSRKLSLDIRQSLQSANQI